MGTLGRLVHVSFDLVLVSALMAGVKRSTGLTLKTSSIEDKDAKGFVDRYLDVGEWVFDTSIAFMAFLASCWCEKKGERIFNQSTISVRVVNLTIISDLGIVERSTPLIFLELAITGIMMVN